MAPVFTGNWFGFGASVGGPTISDAGPIIATGGNVSALTPGNGYKYHTFTSPGELVLTSGSGNVEILVVAGGGGGGVFQSGGGGAGGVAYNPSTPIKATLGPYPITVGSGGPGAQPDPGNPSTALGIIALGGGRGQTRAQGPSLDGGSGGGAGSQWPVSVPKVGTQPTQPQPPGTVNYGNPGGNSPFPTAPQSWQYAGAGGGGAGGAGGSVPPGGNVNGAGGDGVQFPQFTGPLIGVPALAPLSGYFAGGGGGRGDSAYSNGSGGSGGAGGGGAGNNPTGGNGVANSGGGGGGGNPGPGGNGGSGIVVIRYPA